MYFKKHNAKKFYKIDFNRAPVLIQIKKESSPRVGYENNGSI